MDRLNNGPDRVAPDRKSRSRGRAVAELRQEGFELVDEDRLRTMLIDLGIFDPETEDVESEAQHFARRAMEILRG